MKKSEIEARSKRFLEGTRSPDDLRMIFMWLGLQSNRFSTVSEVRHFCSHPDRRDKGLMNGIIRNLADNLILYARALHKDGNFDESDMALVKDVAHSKFNAFSESKFKRKFKFGKKRVKPIFEDALDCFHGIEGEGILADRDLSDLEFKLLKAFCGTMQVEVAFTGDMLIDELAKAMFENGLIERSQINDVKQHREWVSIFAVSAMHLTEIDVREGAQVTLFAARGYTRESHDHLAINWGPIYLTSQKQFDSREKSG